MKFCSRHDSYTVVSCENFDVIDRVHFKPEHFKFLSNCEFDGNLVCGTDQQDGMSQMYWEARFLLMEMGRALDYNDYMYIASRAFFACKLCAYFLWCT